MLNACVRSRSDHTPCGLLLYLRCYLALRDISSSKQEVAEHVIRHPNVMRQNCRPKTKLGMSTAMSLSMERTLKSLAEYAGGVSAFFGAICLLIGWIRLKDARDFLFDLLLKGEISSDWVAAAFLVAGLVLLALAGWSGVLTPPSASRSQDQ
jgi:hypothetical protein